MATVPSFCAHCMSKSNLRILGVATFPHDGLHLGHAKVALGTVCSGCHHPVAILAQRRSNGAGDNATTRNNFLHAVAGLLASNTTITDAGLEVVDYWPKQAEPSVPDHVPAQVGRAFLQAEKNFEQHGHEEAAGAMYRRSLEVGLTAAYPNLKGTLATRIKQLVADQILTKQIGALADGIRLIGNDAAHADEVDREDLVRARAFASAVLQYVFTLPEQVRQQTEAIEKAKAENAEKAETDYAGPLSPEA